MQQYLAITKEWLGPYAGELRVAASIVGVLVLALIVRIVVGKALRLFFEKVAARAALIEERKRIETVSRVTRRTISLLIVLVTAMVVLNQLGISIAPILGAAGVVGIAVGFGAQSLVKDVFAGVVLLIENQIRVGDVVEIAGLSGVVEEMSLRKVKLRSYDGSVHYVSNGLITTVTNRSTEFAYAVMDIGVAYRENVDQVYEVMREVARDLQEDPEFKSRILDALEIAGVDQWADSAVVIRCRIKVQPLEQWGVRREYLKRLKAAFDERGISIPFPHRTIVHEMAPGSKLDPDAAMASASASE
ncbi:mechanosensitive ion channel family protein [Burkholderiaceae bacterium FT117]|uniref:mechanosensitive ion channel family protein n=1 Tax=Zeimonas sediminis TaxID=2944268 RepID=UPI002342CEFE|nr:mechanosensitive ion channel family protein [Zeimonas sediminis]MCM5570828.1 mechanosensitive ion channel family protein [Zeimonas sediminis]